MAVIKPGVKQIQFPSDSPYGSEPLELTSLGSPVVAVSIDLLHNSSNKDLSATYKTVDVYSNESEFNILKINDSALTEAEAKTYVKLITGSDFVSSEDQNEPAYSYVLLANNKLYRFKYINGTGLKAYKVAEFGSGGAAVWGLITGSISNQIDLVNYIENAVAGATSAYVITPNISKTITGKTNKTSSINLDKTATQQTVTISGNLANFFFADYNPANDNALYLDTLKVGDMIYLTSSDKCDWFVGAKTSSSITLYSIEADTPSLSGYATEAWVESNFLSSGALSGYATETWVSSNFMPKTSYYAGMASVTTYQYSWNEQTYKALSISASAHSASASIIFGNIDTPQHITLTTTNASSGSYILTLPDETGTLATQNNISTAISGLAATIYSALTSYATQSWVLSQGYLTSYNNYYHIARYNSGLSVASSPDLDEIHIPYATSSTYGVILDKYSNYLPLSGGTITGDLSVTGNVKAQTLSLASLQITPYENGVDVDNLYGNLNFNLTTGNFNIVTSSGLVANYNGEEIATVADISAAVYNESLTIQLNGSDIGAFTANASTSSVININLSRYISYQSSNNSNVDIGNGILYGGGIELASQIRIVPDENGTYFATDYGNTYIDNNASGNIYIRTDSNIILEGSSYQIYNASTSQYEDIATTSMLSRVVYYEGSSGSNVNIGNGALYANDINLASQIILTPDENGAYLTNNFGNFYLDTSGNVYIRPDEGVYLNAGSGIYQLYNQSRSQYETIATLNDIPSVSAYVPYSGASSNVDLGANALYAGDIGHMYMGSFQGLNFYEGDVNLTTGGGPLYVNTNGNDVYVTASNYNLSVFGASISAEAIWVSTTSGFFYNGFEVATTDFVVANPIGSSATSLLTTVRINGTVYSFPSQSGQGTFVPYTGAVSNVNLSIYSAIASGFFLYGTSKTISGSTFYVGGVYYEAPSYRMHIRNADGTINITGNSGVSINTVSGSINLWPDSSHLAYYGSSVARNEIATVGLFDDYGIYSYSGHLVLNNSEAIYIQALSSDGTVYINASSFYYNNSPVLTQAALDGLVPYSGASSNVSLGAYNLQANSISTNNLNVSNYATIYDDGNDNPDAPRPSNITGYTDPDVYLYGTGITVYDAQNDEALPLAYPSSSGTLATEQWVASQSYATESYVLSHHTMYNTNSLSDANLDNILIAGGVVITDLQLLSDPGLALANTSPAPLMLANINTINNPSDIPNENNGVQLANINTLNIN